MNESNGFYRELSDRYCRPELLLQTCLRTCTESGTSIEVDRVERTIRDSRCASVGRPKPEPVFLASKKLVPVAVDRKLAVRQTITLRPQTSGERGAPEAGLKLRLDERLETRLVHNPVFQAFFASKSHDCFKVTTVEHGFAISIIAYLFAKLIHPIVWPNDTKILTEIHLLAYDYYLKSLRSYYESNPNTPYLKHRLRPHDFLRTYCIHNFKMQLEIGQIHTIGQMRSNDRRIYNFEKALRLFFEPHARKTGCLLETKQTVRLIWRLSSASNLFFVFDPFAADCCVRNAKHLGEIVGQVVGSGGSDNDESPAANKVWFAISEIRMKGSSKAGTGTGTGPESLGCCDCDAKEREFYALDWNAIVFQLVLPNEAILFGPVWPDVGTSTVSLAYAITTFFYIRNCDYMTQFWTVYDLEQICNLTRSLIEQNTNLDFALVENIRTEKTFGFESGNYSYRIVYEFTKCRSANRLHLLCGHLLCEDQVLLKFQKLLTFSRCCLVEIAGTAPDPVEYVAVWKQDSYYSLFRRNGRLTLATDLRNVVLHILKEYEDGGEGVRPHGKSFRLFAIQVTGSRVKLRNVPSPASSLDTLAIDLDAPFLAETQLLHCYDWMAGDEEDGGEDEYCLTRGKLGARAGDDGSSSSGVAVAASKDVSLEQTDLETITMMVERNSEVVAVEERDGQEPEPDPMLAATQAKKLSKVYEERIVQDMLEVTRTLLLNSETVIATEDVALEPSVPDEQPQPVDECPDDLSENNDFYGNEEVEPDEYEDDDGYTTVYETTDNEDVAAPSASLQHMNRTMDECGQNITDLVDELEKANRLMIPQTDEIAAILDEIVARALEIVSERSSSKRLLAPATEPERESEREPAQFCIEEKFALEELDSGPQTRFRTDSNKDELSDRTPLPSYFEDVIESKSLASLVGAADAAANDLFAVRELKANASKEVVTAIATAAIIKDPIGGETEPIDVRKSYLQTKDSDCDCFQSVRVAKKFIKLPDGIGIIVTPLDICISGHIDGLESRFVCVAALLYAANYPIENWTKNLICNVLNSGCQLKCWMAANRTLFYRSRFVNLQMPVFFAKNRFSSGTRIERLLNTSKLTAQLLVKVLFERCSKMRCFSAGLIETSRYSCAVLRTRTRFYLFDCCGCNSIGVALTRRERDSTPGYCCLLRFKSLAQLVQRIYGNALEQEGFGCESTASGVRPVSHPILEFLVSSVDVCLLSDRAQNAIYTKPFPVSKFDFRTPKTCGTNIIHGNLTLRGRFVLTYQLKQCHFCCLTAIFTLRLSALPEWTAGTVDQAIRDGIALFQRTRDRFVQDERVFCDVAIRNRSVLVERAVVVRLPIRPNFALQLQRTLRQFDCLLVQFQCSSFVVCRVDSGPGARTTSSCSCYYLFDPYPCTDDGRRDPSERGRSCWTRFQTLALLKRRILHNVCNRSDWFCFYRVEIGAISLTSAVADPPRSETKKYLKAVADRVPPWSRLLAAKDRAPAVPQTEWLVELKNDLLSLWSGPGSAVADYQIRYPILDEKWIAANNIAALIMSTKYSLRQWNGKLLDTILLYGKAFVYHNESVKAASAGSLPGTYHGTHWCLYPFKCTIAVRSIIEGELLPSGKLNAFGLMDSFRYFFEKMNYTLGLLVQRHFEPIPPTTGTGSIVGNAKRAEKRTYLAFGKCDREYFMYDCQSFGEPIYARGTGGSYVLRCGSLDRLINCVRLALSKTGTFIIHELSVREMTDRMDI